MHQWLSWERTKMDTIDVLLQSSIALKCDISDIMEITEIES